MPFTETSVKACKLMYQARHMAAVYEANRSICTYVHATARGHEAIQLAAAFNVTSADFISPYYRDDAMLLGCGFTPYELMLQLLGKADDPFSGGRSYYAHPSSNRPDRPKIIHQSSATGMQAIPSTGVAQAFRFLAANNNPKLPKTPDGRSPLVICSLGDSSVTEGEVAEAFQFAILKKLPIIFLVQDNEWGISATAKETRNMDAVEYAQGFPGLQALRIDGSELQASYDTIKQVCDQVREDGHPWLIQAKVPLLGHHTSGVRKEFYRSEEDLALHAISDPIHKLEQWLLEKGLSAATLQEWDAEAKATVEADFQRALQAPDPDPATVTHHVFAPTPITMEKGERAPAGKEKVLMVDAALLAIRELMEDEPELMFFGQDVGLRLGGVFREAATLADQFGEMRVFNTAIQEAYIIGSSNGLSAAGVKPIVEVQFADYIYPALNQLYTEIAKSSYLTMGKFPVQTLIRVPVGAYGGGGPYHSGSVESTLLSLKGVKVVYPSNAADMKGLLKAAFHDPNPVVMLEHKGIYWSKVPGTETAKTIEPSRDYIIPLGKARTALAAELAKIEEGTSVFIVTYGMGVYWSLAAAKSFPGQIEILDLRTLHPIDDEAIDAGVRKHGKCIIVSEEQQQFSFAEALAGQMQWRNFQYLDAPIQVVGALNLPAVPLNKGLEAAMLPSAAKVKTAIAGLLEI